MRANIWLEALWKLKVCAAMLRHGVPPPQVSQSIYLLCLTFAYLQASLPLADLPFIQHNYSSLYPSVVKVCVVQKRRLEPCSVLKMTQY